MDHGKDRTIFMEVHKINCTAFKLVVQYEDLSVLKTRC